MKKLVMLFATLLTCFSANLVSANEGFPGRAEYPEISVFENADLAKNFDNVVIVDARSKLEFNTIHIKGALNIPVASPKFAEQILALRKQTQKPIVFYCNGRSCYKSYLAAKAAMKHGVRDVHAYDAGVFEWANAHPESAMLLGSSPVMPNQILSKNKLKAHTLSVESFTEKARSTPANKRFIVDVRDKYQRAGVGFFPGIEKWASLDDEQKLVSYLKKAQQEKRTIYIYDETGKQVRWLQYTLERENISNYYFMEKGVKGFYKTFIHQPG